jgi:HEAT repeat protein
MSALDILVESPPDITAVPALVRILDQDPDKRPVVLAGLAAKILGGLKAKEAVQGLVNCLWRTDAYGRNSAPECRVALTQLGPKNTFDMLVKTLQRKNESVEQRATQYGFKDKGAVEAKVADLLGQLGNPRATDILLGYLTLSETPLGCECFFGEEEEKEALSKGKKSKKERCIAEQVEFLEDSYFSKKKEECIQLQADYVLGQTERFLQVTKALAKLQADKALPKLIEFAQAETSALQVKQAVVEQLAVMGKPKAVPMLMKLLKDKDAYILPEGTEVDKLGEESPNARSGSDRNGGRPGLIRAIHDYRQKILTTAVRIVSPNDEKANKAIVKEIADTRSRFAAFKK